MPQSYKLFFKDRLYELDFGVWHTVKWPDKACFALWRQGFRFSPVIIRAVPRMFFGHYRCGEYFFNYFCREFNNVVNMQKKNVYLESVLDLNSGNVWGVDAQEILELWQKDVKEEGFSSSEDKVLNVIRMAFEVHHFDPKDEREMAKYNNGEYVILNCTDRHKGTVALRKKAIRQITDLSYENVKHITASELLALIDRNFGGGWDSISLAIKDIIETAFDISTTTLPASRIHAPGGTLERKVADGYDVLEIPKGTWVEAIFAKEREPMEKLRFTSDQEYDEEGNRLVHDEEEDDRDDDRDDDDKDEVEANDETFYESYTPEADIKDVEDELADE